MYYCLCLQYGSWIIIYEKFHVIPPWNETSFHIVVQQVWVARFLFYDTKVKNLQMHKLLQPMAHGWIGVGVWDLVKFQLPEVWKELKRMVIVVVWSTDSLRSYSVCFICPTTLCNNNVALQHFYCVTTTLFKWLINMVDWPHSDSVYWPNAQVESEGRLVRLHILAIISFDNFRKGFRPTPINNTAH